MKKLISMLLVLTMTLALASTAMAACNLERYDWVEFVKDANSYTAAKASKKTNNVVKAGSVAQVERVCGDYVRLIVNVDAMTMCWFKSSALKEITSNRMTNVVWAKGGKGMSTSVTMERIEGIKGYYVKVTGHTNLRSFPGLERKSQGVVEKCALLKTTGYIGVDNRIMIPGSYNWVQVCYKGRHLWASANFLKTTLLDNIQYVNLYTRNGKFVMCI
jgi:hypothetical protein